MLAFFNYTKTTIHMNKIVKKEQFSEKVFCLEVEASLIEIGRAHV